MTHDEIMEQIKLKPITIDDLDNCWFYAKSYFVDVLNGDYELDVAREDLLGLIGSKFDRRNIYILKTI